VYVCSPLERAGWCDFGGQVLQMVSEPTLVVVCTGQCADIGHMACVGLRWDTRHGIWFLDICSGQCADICIRVWVWDGAHGMAYGLALDG
jgi:hypothetical protein